VSRETSAKKPSSSEDEESSITGMFPEGPPCSNTGEQGWHEEISDEDSSGGGNPDSAGDELWSRWMKDPQWRESMGACNLSCPPLLAS
jgi:hypothetical protein